MFQHSAEQQTAAMNAALDVSSVGETLGLPLTRVRGVPLAGEALERVHDYLTFPKFQIVPPHASTRLSKVSPPSTFISLSTNSNNMPPPRML